MDTHMVPAEWIMSLRKHWGWILSAGIAAVVLGIVALGAVGLMTLASVVVFGWVLMIAGVFQAINAFHWRVGEGLFLYLLSGVLRFVVGILLVTRPLLGAEAITLLLGAFFLVGGGVRIVTSVFMRLPGWAWMLLNGVVTLVLGLLILNQWPSSTIWVIGLFVGIDLVFDGWSMIAVALMAHRLPEPPGAVA